MKPRRSTSRKSLSHRLQVESLEARRVLTAWHNDALAADVDSSGVVAPLDALLVINELGERDFSDPVTGRLPEGRPGEAPFLDVTDNLIVAPLDALEVINELGSNTFSVPENAAEETLVGQVQPAGGLNENSIFEFEKDSSIPADIRDVLTLKPDDHYQGAADAPVLFIEYVDFACPICGLYHPQTQQALNDFDGEVAMVTRHFPLTSVHPNAALAAIAAEAAGRQGMFHEMGDLLFTRRLTTEWDMVDDPNPIFRNLAAELRLNSAQFNSDLDDPDLAARVQRDRDEAISVLGFRGTPSFIVNDAATALPGATQAAVDGMFQSAVDAVDDPFKLDRFTGEFRVRDSSLLDFETNPSISFDVQVNDSLEAVQVNLDDVPGL